MRCRLFAVFRRHALHRGLAKALLLPVAVVDDGPQVADGVDLLLEGPVYRASSTGSALYAKNQGVIRSEVPLDLEGGTEGATINVDSQATVDIVVGHVNGTSGNLALVSNAQLRLRGSSDQVHGLFDMPRTGGNGVNAFSGSSITLDKIDFDLAGAGTAVSVAQGDTVWRHSVVRSTNVVSFGADLKGGTALLEDVDIQVGGTGIYAQNGVDLTLRDSHLGARTGSGLSVSSGARVVLQRVSVDAFGGAAGLMVRSDAADAQLENVQVHTRGYSSGALMIGADAAGSANAGTSVYANHIDFHTEGTNSLGIDIRNGYVQINGGSIVTDGYASHGAHAWGQKYPNVHQKLSYLDITTHGNDSLSVGSRSAVSDVDHSHVLNTGDRTRTAGAGLGARDGGVINFTDGTVETTGSGTPGARAWNGAAQLHIDNSSITTHGPGSFGVELIGGGQAGLQDVAVLTLGEGAWGAMVQGPQDHLRMHGGSIVAEQSGALYAGGGAQIEVDGGAALRGNGLLLGLDSTALVPMDFTLSQSNADGDIRWVATQEQQENPQRLARVTLLDGAQWHGATDAVDSLHIDHSTWQLRDISSVSQLTLDNGSIRFDTPEDHRYKRLRVLGDYSGSGGDIAMSVHLNGGGPEQRTDQLLIKGDVTTTGTTWLDITPRGTGGNTDRNQNGVVDADEGISVVQVSGLGRRNAFALRNGYVVVGPWQYSLHTFGPGQTQASGADGDPLRWDYRLANRYVSQGGDSSGGGDAGTGTGTGDGNNVAEGEGGVESDFDPGPVQPVGPTRPAVVPQVPAYLTAPTALYQYGNRMMDSLQQRLGDVRLPRADGNDGELYARYIGGGQRYHTNRSFTEYGYDFYQHSTALQVGAGLIGWVGDRGAVRVGWAVDSGRTSVTPIAVDGVTRSRFDAHGGMAWLTWLADAGWHASAVVGGESYGGRLDSGSGEHIARLRAHSWAASVELGYPIVFGSWQLEPQWQIRYQTMRFPLIEDRDGLQSSVRVSAQTIHRLGLSLARATSQRWSPYARIDLMHAEGGAIDLDVRSPAWNLDSSFAGGRMANVYRVGAGLHAQLTRHWALYAEGDYLGTIGAYGFSGWLANTGLRFDF